MKKYHSVLIVALIAGVVIQCVSEGSLKSYEYAFTNVVFFFLILPTVACIHLWGMSANTSFKETWNLLYSEFRN